MSDIKIFVSHRIDLDSETIDNPLYIPVRCGAVYDNKNDSNIQGDNTGDNISSRRMSFCEFTVQYWAWKNVDAEYYGLCHYRRFLSFADKRFKTNQYNNMIHVPMLNKNSFRKFGLLQPEEMEKLIRNFDVIVSEYADIRRMPTPIGTKQTVFEHWRAYDGEFLEKSTLYRLLELIQTRHPEYFSSAKEYLEAHWHRGYNCYVMRKDLFFKMCEFQFDIMFEIEKALDTTGYSETMKRTPAFIGEILYGIFIYHITKQEKYRIKELQLVFFGRTDRIDSKLKLALIYLWYWTDLTVRFLVDPIIPKGTKRREFAKKVFYSVLPIEPRGVANPKNVIKDLN